MNKLILSLSLLFVSSIAVQAQSSDKILNELSAKAKTFTSVYAEYSSRLIDQANGIDLTQEGKVYVQGEKYNIELGDYVMVTDGENIWTYEKATNDCYLDYLEDVGEDAALNPSKMFTVWEQDFKHEFKQTITENGRALFWINLYPNNPAEKAFHTIQLYVDKEKMEVVKFVVKGREGSDVIYIVKKFQPNKEMPASTFKFDQKKFPGANIIDNRL